MSPAEIEQRTEPLQSAARRARMSAQRLLRRVQAGEVAGFQVAGRFWVVETESLDQFIARSERELQPTG